SWLLAMKIAATKNNSRWAHRALLGFTFLAPFLGLYLSRTNLVLALAPIFVSHMLLLYATLVANCQWWGPVVRSFETKDAEVWLSIDHGPSAIHTPQILALLEPLNAAATFFLL